MEPSVLPSLRKLCLLLWMRSCWTAHAITDLNRHLRKVAPQLESFTFKPSAQILLSDVHIFRWLSPKLRTLALPLDYDSPTVAAIATLHADIRLSALWLYCDNDVIFDDVCSQAESVLLSIDGARTWKSSLFSKMQLLVLPATDTPIRIQSLLPPSIRIEQRQLNYDDFDVQVEQLITGAARLNE